MPKMNPKKIMIYSLNRAIFLEIEILLYFSSNQKVTVTSIIPSYYTRYLGASFLLRYRIYYSYLLLFFCALAINNVLYGL